MSRLRLCLLLLVGVTFFTLASSPALAAGSSGTGPQSLVSAATGAVSSAAAPVTNAVSTAPTLPARPSLLSDLRPPRRSVRDTELLQRFRPATPAPQALPPPRRAPRYPLRARALPSAPPATTVPPPLRRARPRLPRHRLRRRCEPRHERGQRRHQHGQRRHQRRDQGCRVSRPHRQPGTDEHYHAGDGRCRAPRQPSLPNSAQLARDSIVPSHRLALLLRLCLVAAAPVTSAAPRTRLPPARPPGLDARLRHRLPLYRPASATGPTSSSSPTPTTTPLRPAAARARAHRQNRPHRHRRRRSSAEPRCQRQSVPLPAPSAMSSVGTSTATSSAPSSAAPAIPRCPGDAGCPPRPLPSVQSSRLPTPAAGATAPAASHRDARERLKRFCRGPPAASAPSSGAPSSSTSSSPSPSSLPSSTASTSPTTAADTISSAVEHRRHRTTRAPPLLARFSPRAPARPPSPTHSTAGFGHLVCDLYT